MKSNYQPKLFRAGYGERKNGYTDAAIEARFRNDLKTDFELCGEAVRRARHRDHEISEMVKRFMRDEDLSDAMARKKLRDLEQQLVEAKADTSYCVEMLSAAEEVAA